MTKTYLIAFVLLSLGLTLGVLYTTDTDGGALHPGHDKQNQSQQTTITKPGDTDQQHSRIQALEANVAALETRLARIENTRIVPGATGQTIATLRNEPTAASTEAATLPPLDALVASGIDPQTAQEITIRQSQVQLARLELRDKAIREEYIGTPQFQEELTALRAQETKIRDEVEETAYDRYLYHTGQTNRVSVESVILGSNAEVNGIKSGDMILRYEDKPLYNFRDLRSATTLGEKDELIDVTVQRGDTQLVVSLPRGPLGVRLNSLRVDPEDS